MNVVDHIIYHNYAILFLAYLTIRYPNFFIHWSLATCFRAVSSCSHSHRLVSWVRPLPFPSPSPLQVNQHYDKCAPTSLSLSIEPTRVVGIHLFFFFSPFITILKCFLRLLEKLVICRTKFDVFVTRISHFIFSVMKKFSNLNSSYVAFTSLFVLFVFYQNLKMVFFSFNFSYRIGSVP